VAFDAEQDLLRREAFEREAKRQEADNARLLHQVGQGCLAVGAMILNSYGAVVAGLRALKRLQRGDDDHEG
jgi:hypothetical protein